jgi:hypothetical protein
VNDDGSMMRGMNLDEFAKKYLIKKISIAEIKAHAAKKDSKTQVAFEWAKLPLGEHPWK